MMSKPEKSEGSRKQTVLIAEDDPLLAEAIAATLDLESLETVVTHNGKEALSLARKMIVIEVSDTGGGLSD